MALNIATTSLIGVQADVNTQPIETEDAMICEVEPLDNYGMDGKSYESICANIFDYTDFTIVEDRDNGDLLQVEKGEDNHGVTSHKHTKEVERQDVNITVE